MTPNLAILTFSPGNLNFTHSKMDRKWLELIDIAHSTLLYHQGRPGSSFRSLHPAFLVILLDTLYSYNKFISGYNIILYFITYFAFNSQSLSLLLETTENPK